MEKKSFKELFSKENFKQTWKKILVTFILMMLCSVFAWLGICGIVWLFNSFIEKKDISYGAILVSPHSIFYYLGSLALSAGIFIFMFLRWSQNLSGNFFNKNKDEHETDTSIQWLKQGELEKRLIVLTDENTPWYPTWSIEGVKNVKNSKGKIVEDAVYHILAADKLCLQRQIEKENNEIKSASDKNNNQALSNLKPTTINGGKEIKSLISGATITIGGARSGKTQQIIKPSILHLMQSKVKCSMLICDLKGDIFKTTSKLAKENGYNVLRFNTTNSKFSHSWNPLGKIWELYYETYLPSWLEKKHLENLGDNITSEQKQKVFKLRNIYLTAQNEIQQQLETIVQAIAPVDPNAKQKYFDQRAQALIKFYFLILLDHGVEKEDYTIFNVAVNSKIIGSKRTILAEMLPEWGISKLLSSKFGSSDSRTSTQDVEDTADNALEMFCMQEIMNLTTPNDNSINFNDFIEKPTVIYLSIDVSHSSDTSSTNKLAILFMELLYAHLQKHLTLNNKEAFDTPILFIIDEFGNLPKMQFMLQLFSLDQGKNIMPHLVIQSLSQVDKSYSRDDRKILFDSTQCFLLCSGVNKELAEILSSRGGQAYRKTYGKQVNEKNEVVRSENHERYDRIPQDQFINIEIGREMVIAPFGLVPAKIEYKPANQVAWIKKMESELEYAFDEEYGTNQQIEDVNFFKKSVNPEIVKLFMYWSMSQNTSQEKKQLREELARIKLYSDYNLWGPKNEERFKEVYATWGGYPCKCLDNILTKMGISEYGFKLTKGAKDKKVSKDEINILDFGSGKINKSKKQFLDYDALVEKINESYEKLNSYKENGNNLNEVIKSFLFLYQFESVDSLEEKIISTNQFDLVWKSVSTNKKYGKYLDLIDINEANIKMTFDQVLSKFKDIALLKTSEENAFYQLKLMNLLVHTWTKQNKSTSKDNNVEIYTILMKIFKMQSIDSIKTKFKELSKWCSEIKSKRNN